MRHVGRVTATGGAQSWVQVTTREASADFLEERCSRNHSENSTGVDAEAE
jgi:hypothetical protein